MIPESPTPPTITPRALFVDDEPYVLKALQRIFIDDDIDIDLAANGEEALDFLNKNQVDLILSDHNMPGISGVELLRRSREIQPDCIRVLITGKGDLSIAVQAINEGHIYKFFSKPWEDEDVRISILRAIEFKRAQEQVRQQKEKLLRLEAFKQTMVTVSHYINNFNCGLIMSMESLKHSPDLSDKEKKLVEASLKATTKISEVLSIMNQLQDLKIADYPYTKGMIDIEEEVEEVIRRIDETE